MAPQQTCRSPVVLGPYQVAPQGMNYQVHVTLTYGEPGPAYVKRGDLTDMEFAFVDTLRPLVITPEAEAKKREGESYSQVGRRIHGDDQ
ncbi:hypothetical protein [Streptomyces sp. NPDC002573]|uniref:hypothetical protein n=1 Tax=Streptomyces sp. NPDC002573 TaxID=3364651 RepID=UPI0036BF6337